MKHFCSIFAVLITVITSVIPAHAADWEGVFEGTIGKSKVIVELNAGNETSDFKGGYSDGARYNYLPKTRDLNLMLIDDEGNTLRFTETLWPHRRFADEEDKKITGSWTLSVNGDTALGTWASPDGKTSQPISLTRAELVPEADVAEGNNRLTTTYENLWLETVTFADAGTAKTFGDVEVRFRKDSAFGIAFPVLGQFPDGASKAKANTMLLTQHMKTLAAHRECQNGIPTDWTIDNETSSDFQYSIDYASPRVLSYTVTGSVFCGGAHPNNFVIPHTYDLTNGSRLGGDGIVDLKPEGFGQVLKLATKQERIAFERFALGRWREAAAKDPEMGKDCATGWIDDALEGEREFHLSIASTGLAVTRTDWPHVSSVCKFTDFNPTIIPWADIKPWLKPGQTLITTEIK